MVQIQIVPGKVILYQLATLGDIHKVGLVYPKLPGACLRGR